MPFGFPADLDLKYIEQPSGSRASREFEHRPLPRAFLAGSPRSAQSSSDREPGFYVTGDHFTGNPFRDAPLNNATGGTIYFEAGGEEPLRALLRLLLGFVAERQDFVAFGISAANPVEERFLDQIKIIPNVALSSLLDSEIERLTEDQRLTIEEAVIGFVRAQSEKWNEPGRIFSPRLEGAAGGDGEYAKEALAFGLHVESSHWSIVRIWSRPWLVLK